MNKNILRKRRIKRVRAKVAGTDVRPRLAVTKSLRIIYAQIIDDASNKTLLSLDSRKIKKAEGAQVIAGVLGEEIAKIALAKGIKEVVFDRRGRKYHGAVKALADGARKGGLIL
ncbi:MAG: 50S ribosomal protein L18 [Parcubacteria group bacterium]|jgi:large subunit ribosomal protein L18